MSNILIVGTNSFIGSNFKKYSSHQHISEISLLDKAPEDIDFSAYDTILHLAAIVHQSKKIDPEIYYRVNRDLCIRTAQKAKQDGVKHFIFMSTVKVYGDKTNQNMIRNENSTCTPDDDYGKSKFEAEQLLQKMNSENFVVSIIRTPLVYGENVKANMYNIVRLVDKFPILPFAKIENKRSFTFVENLIAYIDRICELKISGTFIAMDKESWSTTMLVRQIANSLQKKVWLFKFPRFLLKLGYRVKPAIFERLYGSYEFENKQTLTQLNFEPPYSTQKGIEKMILSIKNMNIA